jgi:serine/threonine protein phosphatase 1
MLYAVGDIHGESEMLSELLAKLPLVEGDRVVFVGDYVDRGPDSKGVVDKLIAFSREHACEFLLGNHESMFLDFLGWRGSEYFGGDAFLMNGGDRTLASYDYFRQIGPGKPGFTLPRGHEEFFRRLKLHHQEGDYLFVHAGIGRDLLAETDVAWALKRAHTEDLLWDRATADLPHELGITIVYGHTPNPDFQVRWNPPFSIGIDAGAVYGGRLTAIRLPDETLFQV